MTEVRAERMATGGEAVARLDDGRVAFVRGALPGERVAIEITEQKKRFVRGVAVDIVEASPQRVDPPCSHARSGECGGCDWLMLGLGDQRAYKVGIVVEQLQRLGGVEAPDVVSFDMGRGTRTTVRCSVVDGRAGYRRRRSDVAFAATSCQAANPLVEQLMVEGRFGDASEVTLRAGAATGDRLVITNGDPNRVEVPSDVLVVASHDVGDAAIYEQIAARRWRISAQSFFQTSHEGAEALVAAVTEGLDGSTGSVVDLYAGVGLLGGAAAPERLVCSVESNPSSSSDAAHNLSADVQIVNQRVERWTPVRCDAVIADPARRGLGKDGAAAIGQTGASRLVLVSCDPASLGRDTALLIEQGWRFDRSQVVDMFPDTSRIEAVSTFTR